MSPGNYTEDTLVQQTTADCLKQGLGWESVYAYDNEDCAARHLLLPRLMNGEIAA